MIHGWTQNLEHFLAKGQLNHKRSRFCGLSLEDCKERSHQVRCQSAGGTLRKCNSAGGYLAMHQLLHLDLEYSVLIWESFVCRLDRKDGKDCWKVASICSHQFQRTSQNARSPRLAHLYRIFYNLDTTSASAFQKPTKERSPTFC